MSKTSSKYSIKSFIREVVIFVSVLFVASYALNLYRAPKLDSDTLPHIKAKLIDGTIFDSSTIGDRPLLINFWGTWCPVCAQEASNIESVSKSYRVITVAVNSGSDDKIKEWMKDKGVSYPVINDSRGSLAESFKVSIYPTIFIYDSRGKLKFTETGYSTTAGLLARMRMAK